MIKPLYQVAFINAFGFDSIQNSISFLNLKYEVVASLVGSISARLPIDTEKR
jgi:hypothetical protein